MFLYYLVGFLLLQICIANDPTLDTEWQSYKERHSKQYIDAKTDALRRGIWETNMRYIERHNEEAARGLHTYKLGMNVFGDMTNLEFAAMMKFNVSKRDTTKASVCTKYIPPATIVPSSVDWRDKGYVTLVKNMGQCGNAWAFSVTGSLEGQNYKKTGILVSLSEQNLVDCVGQGCEDIPVEEAFAYVIRNGGIDTEASYPYQATSSKCRFSNKTIGATEKGCMDIESGPEQALQRAVANIGPILVYIDANHASFQLYRDGVYNERHCSTSRLDYSMLVVGYGTDQSGHDYWIVKNWKLYFTFPLGHKLGQSRVHFDVEKQTKPVWDSDYGKLSNNVNFTIKCTAITNKQ